MGLRTSLAMVVCVAAIVASGCDSGTVTVRSDLYQHTAELSGDQTLVLRLSNRRPADNAPWDWHVLESGVVELVSSEVNTLAENESVSADWKLTFAPVRAGTADLVLVYRLPGQPEVQPTLAGAYPEYVVTVTVTSQPDG
jgi:hypothetical protein